ncbi:MAG: 2OG-Fe(II) oxygenase [Albidovulum sp.]|nr:2OG-Fe(II) oxygenase [Albidovulum sp.]
MNISPNFGHSRRYSHPFRHAWIPNLFPKTAIDGALEWLENNRSWQFTETGFYRQFEFSLKEINVPNELAFLVDENTLSGMHCWFRTEFVAQEIESVDVVAHLLLSGHDIGIHNDYRPDGETHRLILQLGRDVNGGITALFRNKEVTSLFRLIHPIHGTAFAFEISEASYHAVSKVRGGQRFSLIYSFRSRQ